MTSWLFKIVEQVSILENTAADPCRFQFSEKVS